MANNIEQFKLNDALNRIIQLKRKNNRLQEENSLLIKENSQLKRINADLLIKIDCMVDIEEVND